MSTPPPRSPHTHHCAVKAGTRVLRFVVVLQLLRRAATAVLALLRVEPFHASAAVQAVDCACESHHRATVALAEHGEATVLGASVLAAAALGRQDHALRKPRAVETADAAAVVPHPKQVQRQPRACVRLQGPGRVKACCQVGDRRGFGARLTLSK